MAKRFKQKGKRYSESSGFSTKQKINAIILVIVLLAVLIIESSLSFFSDVVFAATNAMLGTVSIEISEEEIDDEGEWRLGDTRKFEWTITNTSTSAVELSNTFSTSWVNSVLSTENVIEIQNTDTSTDPIILAPEGSHTFVFEITFAARENTTLSREYLLAFDGLDLEIEITTTAILPNGSTAWYDTAIATLILENAIVEPEYVWEFDYTGEVETLTLQPGVYHLQVWGAQGNNVTVGNMTGIGGNGAFAEGALIIESTTTLSVFAGTRRPSGSNIANGGGGGRWRRWFIYFIRRYSVSSCWWRRRPVQYGQEAIVLE